MHYTKLPHIMECLNCEAKMSVHFAYISLLLSGFFFWSWGSVYLFMHGFRFFRGGGPRDNEGARFLFLIIILKSMWLKLKTFGIPRGGGPSSPDPFLIRAYLYFKAYVFHTEIKMTIHHSHSFLSLLQKTYYSYMSFLSNIHHILMCNVI